MPPKKHEKFKLTKEEYYRSIKNHHEESVKHADIYWRMLTGHKPNMKYVHIDEVLQNEEKANRIKNHCQAEIMKISIDISARAVALYTLRMMCHNPAHFNAVILMDALAVIKEPEELLKKLYEEFPIVEKQALEDKTIDFFWLEYILGTTALSADQEVAEWGIKKCYEYGQREELWPLWSEHFFSFYLTFALGKNDFFYRLIDRKEIEDVLKKMGFIFRQMCTSAVKLRQLLTTISNTQQSYAIFYIVSAMTYVGMGEPVLEFKDVELMWRVVDAANDKLGFATMRCFAIRQAISFFAKITKLDIDVLDAFADMISHIVPIASPLYIETIVGDIHSIVIESGYKTESNLTLNMYMDRLKESIRVRKSSAVPRGKIFWTSLCNEPEKRDQMVVEVEKRFKGLMETRKTHLESREVIDMKSANAQTELFILYLERPGGGVSEEFDELTKKCLRFHVLSFIWHNNGHRREFYSWLTVFQPLFIRISKGTDWDMPITFSQYIPRFDGIYNRVYDNHALLLMFLGLLAELRPEQITAQDAANWILFSGNNANERIAVPRIDFNPTLPREDQEMIYSIVHQIRLQLYMRMIPLCGALKDETARKEFRNECFIQLNDKSLSWSPRTEIINLLIKNLEIFNEAEAFMNVKFVDNIFKNQDVTTFAAWRAFFKLQCRVFSKIRFNDDLVEKLFEIVERPFHWSEGIANELLAIPYAFSDTLKEEIGYSWIAYAKTIVMLGTFKTNDTEFITDTSDAQKDNRKSQFAFDMIKMTEHVMPSDNPFDCYDEYYPKTRIAAIQQMLHFCSTGDAKKWSNEFLRYIRHYGLFVIPMEVRRRAFEMLLMMTGCRSIDWLAVYRFCHQYFQDRPKAVSRLLLLAEWALARACLKSKAVWKSVLVEAQQEEFCVSYIRVLLFVCRVDPTQIPTCLEILTPLSDIHYKKGIIRRAAFAAVRLLWQMQGEEIEDDMLDKLKRKVDKWHLNKAPELEMYKKDEDAVRSMFRDVFISKLHVEKHFSFQSVLHEVPKMVGVDVWELPGLEIMQRMTANSHNYEIPVEATPDENFYRIPSHLYTSANEDPFRF